MRIKRVAKIVLPEKIAYGRGCKIYADNARRSYREAEDEINKRFWMAFGREIKWVNPITFNEKMNVSKLYGSTPIKTRLADKILVSNWVKEKVKKEERETIPLLAAYD